MIDLLFDCYETEQSLSFEPGCFKTMDEMIAQYQKGDVEISPNKEQKRKAVELSKSMDSGKIDENMVNLLLICLTKENEKSQKPVIH